jgi:hypothetical protein
LAFIGEKILKNEILFVTKDLEEFKINNDRAYNKEKMYRY